MAVRAAAQQLPRHAGVSPPPPGGPARPAAAPPGFAALQRRREGGSRRPFAAGGLPAGPPRSPAARHQLGASQHRGPRRSHMLPAAGTTPPSESSAVASPPPRLPPPRPLRRAAGSRRALGGVPGRLYLFTIRSVFFLSGARLQRIAWLKGCGMGGSLTGSKPPPRRDGLAYSPGRPPTGLSALRQRDGRRAGARPTRERAREKALRPQGAHASVAARRPAADWRRALTRPLLIEPGAVQLPPRRGGGRGRTAAPEKACPRQTSPSVPGERGRSAPRRAPPGRAVVSPGLIPGSVPPRPTRFGLAQRCGSVILFIPYSRTPFAPGAARKRGCLSLRCSGST